MNVLAKKQKSLSEENLSLEEQSKKEQEFLLEYYSLRENDENSFWGKLSLKSRKKLHKYVLAVHKVKNYFSGFRCEVLNDKRNYTERPVIFAVTHVGKFDIEVVSEAVADHYYLLSGDFEHLQGTIEGWFLNLNGVIYFNEKVKEERRDVVKRMINHLKTGGNLMYFPEGTWNLTPNRPVLPLYWGIIEIAKRSNAVIIPVAAEQYGKRFTVNIDENFDVNRYGDDKEEKIKAISDLEDIFATLKWELWENEPLLERKLLKGDEWDEYVEERLKEWPYFNEEYIHGMTYKPKNVYLPEEVFAPIQALEVKKDNAFLLDKRISGRW